MPQCQLCKREINQLTVHHLIPRQATKRKKVKPGPTVEICSACHRQIHILFTNQQLAHQLNSLEALQQDPQMNRFLTWISKQDPSRHVKVERKRS